MVQVYPIIVEFENTVDPGILIKRGIEIIDQSQIMPIIHAKATKEQILDLSNEKNIKVISLSAKVTAIC